MVSDVSQIVSCTCSKSFKIRNRKSDVFFSPLNQVQDNRLLSTLKSVQPTYLKFNTQLPLELLKVKNRRLKDDSLVGYNRIRGDFEVEYNNNAESLAVLASELNNCFKEKDDINEGCKDEKTLIKNLQVVLGEQYNSQLKEREWMKATIRKHGLMNLKGTSLWFSKLEVSLGKSHSKKIIRLCPLTSADEMEQLSTSLSLLSYKRAEINKLNFFRTQRGITSKWDMAIFEKERFKREIREERLEISNLATPQVSKKKRMFLDIFHLPRYKELSHKEADLCKLNGIQPSFYLDIKDLLISDCKKNNGLLLKRARKLVKIDVNKTRKIYDLLLEEGHTWLPGRII